MKKILPLWLWFPFLLYTAESLLQYHWEAALVVFAAMAIVPRGLFLLGYDPAYVYAFTVVGLAWGYSEWPNHDSAVWWALPYGLGALWLTVWEFVNMLVYKKYDTLTWMRIVALGYWATGALGGVFFLADLHPLGFDSQMIGLTSAHFHVAGFVPAVMVYCLYEDNPRRAGRRLGYAVAAGMPAVAAGITLTHLGFSPVFEWVAATGFVGLIFWVVWRQVKLALQQELYTRQREFWIRGSACVVVGAAMGGVYALRFYWPFDWFTIPNMRFWHGTLNTIGFGWLVLRGWLAYADRERMKSWDGSLPGNKPLKKM